MGVFSSLLPGLRDLRAPLAAGYLWLFNLWLLFGDSIPTREEATGLLEDIYELESVVSQFGLLVALSLAAYLFGALSSSVANGILSMLKRPRYAKGRWRYINFVQRRDQALRARYEESSGGTSPLPEPPPDVSQILTASGERWLDEEERVVRARLIAEQAGLFGEYDRLVSEAEFRVSIVVPLLLLVLILAIEVDPLWSLAIAALPILLAQAAVLQTRGNLALTEAVISGKVNSPHLERLQEAVELSGQLADQVNQPAIVQKAASDPSP